LKANSAYIFYYFYKGPSLIRNGPFLLLTTLLVCLAARVLLTLVAYAGKPDLPIGDLIIGDFSKCHLGYAKAWPAGKVDRAAPISSGQLWSSLFIVVIKLAAASG